ncbi:MAG TPA: NfeD family protein [Burkholderiales bacterium]|nr:NfeD family protein [Burkholderiales bacterium]
MEAYVWWAVAGIGLIIVEMMTGTLVLLVLGLAAFAGAAAGWFGGSFWVQALIVAALAAVGMIVASSVRKKSAGARDNVSLDIGHTVILESWVSEADGIAKVRYRNATWDAKVVGAHTPGGTVFYIGAMDGSTLHISSVKPQ